jgi:hypothetical protein
LAYHQKWPALDEEGSLVSVKVESYVIDSAENAVFVEEFHGVFSRDARIYGILELEVDGIPILDRSMGDTIDALWSLFVTALREFVATGEALLSFPERPYTLRMELLRGDRILVRVGGVEVPRSAVIDRADLLRELRSGAIQFFRAVLATSPREEWSYLRDLNHAIALPDR